jgi:hypothetical protein
MKDDYSRKFTLPIRPVILDKKAFLAFFIVCQK